MSEFQQKSECFYTVKKCLQYFWKHEESPAPEKQKTNRRFISQPKKSKTEETKSISRSNVSIATNPGKKANQMDA